MTVKGIECPSCKERIWSRHRHDFRWCKCKEVAVDGGREYLRFVFNKIVPKVVRIKVKDLL